MTRTLPMSKFIQNYNQHLSEAEKTGDDIVLPQRSGRTTWVMATEGRVRDTQMATEYLAAALSALVHDPVLSERFPEALASSLPWVTFLPEDDQRAFAEEAVETLRACASIGRYTAFATLIKDWQSTAEIWSDPDLAQSLGESIDEPVNIPVDVD
jgi:hypothetical protein